MSARPGQIVPVVTPRQTEVIALIARGLSDKEIASALGIAYGTAKQHCNHIRVRLNVAARRQIPYEFMCRTGLDPFPRLESDAA